MADIGDDQIISIINRYLLKDSLRYPPISLNITRCVNKRFPSIQKNQINRILYKSGHFERKEVSGGPPEWSILQSFPQKEPAIFHPNNNNVANLLNTGEVDGVKIDEVEVGELGAETQSLKKQINDTFDTVLKLLEEQRKEIVLLKKKVSLLENRF